jgi:predicted AlkP superfamily phosphohydrolase/phosphomutase
MHRAKKCRVLLSNHPGIDNHTVTNHLNSSSNSMVDRIRVLLHLVNDSHHHGMMESVIPVIREAMCNATVQNGNNSQNKGMYRRRHLSLMMQLE